MDDHQRLWCKRLKAPVVGMLLRVDCVHDPLHRARHKLDDLKPWSLSLCGPKLADTMGGWPWPYAWYPKSTERHSACACIDGKGIFALPLVHLQTMLFVLQVDFEVASCRIGARCVQLAGTVKTADPGKEHPPDSLGRLCPLWYRHWHFRLRVDG